jgi:acetolactate synthase-1/2/3 large subunit
MNPEQEFIPKVKGIKKIDGTIFAPPIEEMSPLLPLSEVKENMIVGLSEKSKLIKR